MQEGFLFPRKKNQKSNPLRNEPLVEAILEDGEDLNEDIKD